MCLFILLAVLNIVVVVVVVVVVFLGNIMSALLQNVSKQTFKNKQHGRNIYHRYFSNKVNVTVNGVDVSVEPGSTVLQACEELNIDVPRFCFHERLSVAGNCRMCLVEIEKQIKPIASCAMPVMPGMNIFTDTPLVKKAREGVLEFLLLNHPLDCPICDQGGECDLQDQSMIFGSDRSRFYELKRGVEDKNLGPLVKTVMTRCIHCTRCVRFATEVAGVETLGTTARGIDTEIGTYVDKPFVSEMSGNIIDLCPVGALTSKPYAFTARPWELKGFESIDVHDSTGANIRVDTRGTEIMRIVPTLNEDINEEWLTDKSRFAYDGMKVQRLTTPLVRCAETGALKPATWEHAFGTINNYLKSEGKLDSIRAKGVVGGLVDAETSMALKEFLNNVSATKPLLQMDDFESDTLLDTDFTSQYEFGTMINGLEESDLVVLVGVNPREEAALINARIRKRTLQGGFEVVVFPDQNSGVMPGDSPFKPFSSEFNYEHTVSPDTLEDVVDGNCTSDIAAKIYNAKNPMVIYGKKSVDNFDMPALLSLQNILRASTGDADKAFLNCIQPSAGSLGAINLGYNSSSASGSLSSIDKVPTADEGNMDMPNFVYAVGVGSNYSNFTPSFESECRDNNAFVVYQGHTGLANPLMMEVADVILPGVTYAEKEATYINTEGRAQQTAKAMYGPGGSRTDWKILRALSEVAGKPLPYDTDEEIKDRLASFIPSTAQEYNVPSGNLETWNPVGMSTPSFKSFAEMQEDWVNENLRASSFYQTDIISENSSAMAKTQNEFVNSPIYKNMQEEMEMNMEQPQAIGK